MRDGVEGEGLLLRPPVPADRARMLELAHDPVQLALGVPVGVPVPRTESDLDDRVASAQEAFGRLTPGDLVVTGLEDTAHFLGTMSWRHGAPPILRIADVGYAVHPDARGRGLASRALRVLVRWLVLDPAGPSLARVQLDHSVENPASCKVALAAHMPREGLRKGFLPLREPGGSGVRRHDVCLHGVVPEDLPA